VLKHIRGLALLLGLPVALTAGAAVPASAAPAGTQLRLVAASTSVTLERWPGGAGVFLDLGLNIVAGARPFEIRVKRDAYRNPVVATQLVRQGGRDRHVRLPAGLVTGFAGFEAFYHLTITDAAGRTVLDGDERYCPNMPGARTRPDAPDLSPYPEGCPTNPFTLGAVWGIQAGWSGPLSSYDRPPIDLAPGAYTAVVSVNQRYRDAFGIPADAAAATVALTVRDGEIMPWPWAVGTPGGAGTSSPLASLAAGGAAAGRRAVTTSAPSPASRPTGTPTVPSGPKPDLRSLPAWNIQVIPPDPDRPPVQGDHLSFNATVWTAGDSPLVVDGFRRPAEDIMDAYQYFYDSGGRQIGYAPVGTMEWDSRDGHSHWHFTDFARYRLLDASMQQAVRSGKEAFCLANTDAVDYTLPRANWRPRSTDLHTACGSSSSIAVREVLDIGSGDTYAQFLPGQSFDITEVPNGTYYVEVTANPDGRLYEQSTANNTSLRRVILGGAPGARTVQVPPHEGIDG